MSPPVIGSADGPPQRTFVAHTIRRLSVPIILGWVALIVLLHGYGSHEGDLFSLSPRLPLAATVASLRGPIKEGAGYAWWSLAGQNIDALEKTIYNELIVRKTPVSMASNPVDVRLAAVLQRLKDLKAEYKARRKAEEERAKAEGAGRYPAQPPASRAAASTQDMAICGVLKAADPSQPARNLSSLSDC